TVNNLKMPHAMKKPTSIEYQVSVIVVGLHPPRHRQSPQLRTGHPDPSYEASPASHANDAPRPPCRVLLAVPLARPRQYSLPQWQRCFSCYEAPSHSPYPDSQLIIVVIHFPPVTQEFCPSVVAHDLDRSRIDGDLATICGRHFEAR